MRRLIALTLVASALLLSACNQSAPIDPTSADGFTTTAVDNINLFIKGVRNPTAAMAEAIGRIPQNLNSSSLGDNSAISSQALNFCPNITINSDKAVVDFDSSACDGKIGDTTVDFSGKINFSGEAFKSFEVKSSPAISLQLSEGQDSLKGSFSGSMSLTKRDAGMDAAIKASYELSGSFIETLGSDYNLALTINKPSLFNSSYSFTGSIGYRKGSKSYTAQVTTPQALEVGTFDFCAGPVKGALKFDFGSDVIDVTYTGCDSYTVKLNGQAVAN